VHSLFFGKTFVKVTFLQKKLLNSWFDDFFSKHTLSIWRKLLCHFSHKTFFFSDDHLKDYQSEEDPDFEPVEVQDSSEHESELSSDEDEDLSEDNDDGEEGDENEEENMDE